MSQHTILERGIDLWVAATATCSCGFTVREPSVKQRDKLVMEHLVAANGSAR